MKIEVLNTGTELLLGSVVNTHLAFFGEELFKLGLRVERQVCVPDGPAIGAALVEAFGRNPDVLLITGGLGPTSDDLTRDLVAGLLGRPLETDAGLIEDIKAKFAKFGRREINPSIARQAEVPAGARVLPNAHGTAPGLYLAASGGPRRAADGGEPPETPSPAPASESPARSAPLPSPHLFLLPGPPRELRPMFSEQVAPILKGLRPAGGRALGMRVYRLVGIGESWVEERIGPALAALGGDGGGGGLEIGYCARAGEVDLRLIGKLEILAEADRIVTPAMGEHLVSAAGESMEQVIVRLLIERKKTVSVAESCTGGLLAHRLTNVTGASNVFPLGLATYTDEIKRAVLGVSKETLAADGGAVSAPVAAAMAAGARRVAGTDYALSTTGFAGPNGGAPDKPVGTVFIGLATPADGPDGPKVERLFFPTTDRETFKFRTTQAAFNLLRRALLADNG